MDIVIQRFRGEDASRRAVTAVRPATWAVILAGRRRTSRKPAAIANRGGAAPSFAEELEDEIPF